MALGPLCIVFPQAPEISGPALSALLRSEEIKPRGMRFLVQSFCVVVAYQLLISPACAFSF